MELMQFLKYSPVQGEKYLGIAIIRWLGKIILRYKVMQSQNGQGYWISSGSVKNGVKHDGKDNYEECFQIDSSFDRDQIKDFILAHVEPILAQTQSSVFAQPQAPIQNYAKPAQQYQPQQERYAPQPNQPYQQYAQPQQQPRQAEIWPPQSAAPDLNNIPF